MPERSDAPAAVVLWAGWGAPGLRCDGLEVRLRTGWSCPLHTDCESHAPVRAMNKQPYGMAYGYARSHRRPTSAWIRWDVTLSSSTAELVYCCCKAQVEPKIARRQEAYVRCAR